tara:strand:- start:412 stop:2271 length:1860 start_codon:yes stop_codon:yes gene_type:complete
MKNIKLTIFYFCICNIFNAQVKSDINFNPCDFKPLFNSNLNFPKSSFDTIAYNTFDDVTDWTISIANLQGQWEVVSTTPADVVTYMGTMASTTASDGFAVFNGIQHLITGTVDFQDAAIELNDTLDLSNYPSVTLEFEQFYRAFNYDKTFVELSTDYGTTWTSVEINDQVTTNDPAIQELVGINISSYVGGQQGVKIRFRWTSDSDDDSFGSGYAWLVDDLKITVPPENDIQNVSSWIFGENSGGAEYGRTPISQVEQNYFIGSSVYNYGSVDQTNVVSNGNFSGPTTLTSSTISSIIESDSTKAIESLNSVSLSVGNYTGSVTVISMGDTLGSANFDNNTYLRNFEITNDVYSLDGIGNHPADYESIGSLGSNSWADVSDGLVCGTFYPLRQEETLNSVKAFITSSTMAQSEVILYILDSLSFTSGLFSNSIFTSELYTVTAQDVNNGFIDIPVANNIGWDPINNTSTWENVTLGIGGYYAAIELYSGGNTYDIRILDDNTVGQPAWSSAIWYPGDQAYSNGNAFAIRMNFGASVDLVESSANKLQIFPNPAKDFLGITLENNLPSELTLMDVSGKVVLEKTFTNSSNINLSNFNNGIYFLSISNNSKIVTKRVNVVK